MSNIPAEHSNQISKLAIIRFRMRRANAMQTSSHDHQREEERPNSETLLTRDEQHKNEGENVSFPQESEEPDEMDSQAYQRGQQRIYLAAVAGSGKTYAMLSEGHLREGRGTSVIIGYVETHGRPQTAAQIGDLEIIPRKQVTYRGMTLEEMDTEAILVRHPHTALVDELAHTNAPGSKHAKRYQDVEELLEAGICVATTLNIQHLESLNDLVASITSVRVRETLPDRILDDADEVELVDISPVALRQRMLHGDIYSPEQIETALKHFFREGNLTALRELALRRAAEKTETQLQQYMTRHGITQRWPASERILVGFDHRPHTRLVLRDAWRLAHGLHADLLAISIEPSGSIAFTNRLLGLVKYGRDALRQREMAQQRLEEHIALAEDLGAEIIRLRSSDIARTLVKVAHERQITQIVLGQPVHNAWEKMRGGSLLNHMFRLNPGIDIHLVPHGRNPEE